LLELERKKPGLSWVWDEDYAPLREQGELILDLLGYFPAPGVKEVLREGTRFRDPHLACYAVTSLLRLGDKPANGVIERVAASPEMRGLLFEGLAKQGKQKLFPPRFANQKALAEAEMVRWLAFPTELGRAPDEIELMKVVSEDFGPPDGMMDWYLFRFRTLPPHWSAKDGWMAGVAGPFKRAEEPTVTAYGDTFSKFAKWDSQTPGEHVNDVRALMAEWRKKKSE